MLKRNAATLALVLLVLALWAVRPATGDDEPETPDPAALAEQLAEHELRITDLERMLGEPQRAAGSIDARLRAAELAVEGLERDIEAGEGGDTDNARALGRLQREVEGLQNRVERLDHNRLAAVERDLAAIQRELRNLDNRLRRIE